MNEPGEPLQTVLARACVNDGARPPASKDEAGTEVHAAFVRLRQAHLLEGGYESVLNLVESWPIDVRPDQSTIVRAARNVFGAPIEIGTMAIVLRTHANRDQERRVPGPMIISELAPEGGVCAFIALPGVGKTLMSVELARCVAAGVPFAGRQVTQGAVLYVCQDAPASTERRLLAINEGAASRIFTITEMPSLPTGIDDLASAVRQANAKADLPVRLIVIDTWDSAREHKSGGYADQDGGAEALMRGLRKLASDHQLAVLIVHHATRQDGGRARGTVVFDARCDWIAVVEATGERLVLRTTKARDGERGVVGAWEICPVMCGERTVPTLRAVAEYHAEAVAAEPGRSMLETARRMVEDGEKLTAKTLSKAMGKKGGGTVDRLASDLRRKGFLQPGSYVPTPEGCDWLDGLAAAEGGPGRPRPAGCEAGTQTDSTVVIHRPSGTRLQDSADSVPPSHTHRGGTVRDDGMYGEDESDDQEDLFANASYARKSRP